MPSLRRTSAGTEICPCEVTLEFAIAMTNITTVMNGIAGCRTFAAIAVDAPDQFRVRLETSGLAMGSMELDPLQKRLQGQIVSIANYQSAVCHRSVRKPYVGYRTVIARLRT